MTSKSNLTSFLKCRYLIKLCLLVVLHITTTKAFSQQQQPYNVILISIDDMNDKVPFLGYPAVLTPNLQRLLNRGMGFTSAYCQFAICNPSRVSMMSGWRPDKTGVQGNNMDPAELVPSNVKYLQDYLHSFGYRTERYGKIYHEKFEYEFNWDYEDDGGNGSSNLTFNSMLAAEPDNPPGTWAIKAGGDSAARHALVKRLVNSLTQSTQPGFYGLGLTVHNPFIPNLTNWNKYGDPRIQVDLPVWQREKTIKGNSSHNIAIPTNTPANDRDDVPAVAFFTNNTVIKSDSEWQKTVQAYYAEVSIMDESMGILLDAMDENNLWENTVIVFISDHGQHLGEHNGLWLKNTLFEESLRVPLIVYAPGKKAGLCDKLVETVDIYPTITELCRIPTPADLEGSSFVRLLDDPAQQWKQVAFSQTLPSPQFPLVGKCESLRTKDYHYNYWGVYGEELYDKINDPQEFTNLATNPAYATVLSQMRTMREQGWKNALPPACDTIAWYLDNDNDGYGDNNIIFRGCYQPAGYAANSGDCNDSNAAIHPGAAEICNNGIDDNCDNQIDETTLQVSARAGIIFCIGGTTTIKITATGGSGIYTGTGEFTVGAGPYNFTVTDSYGCSATVSGSVADGTGNVLSKPGKISGRLYNLCGGGDFTFSVSDVVGATSYTWTVPQSFLIVQNNGSSAVIKAPALFTSAVISVTADNACGSSPARFTTVYGMGPNPSSAIDGPSSVTANQPDVIYKLTNGQGVNYAWTVPVGSAITSGQGTNRIKVSFGTTSGNVSVVASNNCGTTPTGNKFVTVVKNVTASEQSTISVQKTGTQPDTETLNVYPNPARDKINIRFVTGKAGTVQIRIFSITGQEMLSTKQTVLKGVNDHRISISMLSQGVYYAELKDGQTTLRSKFVVGK